MTAPIRVLLAADEVECAASLTRALRRGGMAVSVAHDGEEVVEALRTQDVEVVVMDLRMPRMDGITALDRVRNIGAFTSIILLSGHDGTSPHGAAPPKPSVVRDVSVALSIGRIRAHRLTM